MSATGSAGSGPCRRGGKSPDIMREQVTGSTGEILSVPKLCRSIRPQLNGTPGTQVNRPESPLYLGQTHTRDFGLTKYVLFSSCFKEATAAPIEHPSL